MIDVHRIVNGSLKENCYVAARLGDAVVVDPGGGFERIAAHVADRGLRVHAVLCTHGHVDHLADAVPVVEEYGAPFHLHPGDAHLLPRANFYRQFIHGEERIPIPPIDVSLGETRALRFGKLDVDVLHTPGHTPGGVCFRIGGELFTGDTLTACHLGRTDLPRGDRDALEASVAMVADACPADVTIRPGHGDPARLGDVIADWMSLPELRG